MAVSGWGDYLENKILDHLFGKATWTAPANVYLAASTADPDDDGSGTVEPSGNGYERKQTSASDWNAASGGATANATDIEFAEASGSWGTITHLAFYDAATAGNFLGGAALDESKSVSSGEILRFLAGEIDVTQG